MEWIHDEYSVVEKHAQTMLQLVKFGIGWKCGELEQIVNNPVTQIVEEITEVNIPVTQIVEEITEVNIPVTQIVEEITELNIPVTQIVEEITEVNVPVPQNVEKIAEVSKSSIEWWSIPNLYFEEIKVFLG